MIPHEAAMPRMDLYHSMSLRKRTNPASGQLLELAFTDRH